MRISIFGLGYVGTVSLGCLARDGHTVYGVDIDENKLNLIRRGMTPIIEDGMEDLIREATRSGRVEVTSDTAHAVRSTALSLVCVGTPSRRNGNQDLTAIERVAEQLGKALATKTDYHVVVIRSTVRPRTVEDVIQPILEKSSGTTVGQRFGLCYQPEFLREGSSIQDYLNPPYTIVGGDSPRSIAGVRELFGHFPGEFIATSIRTAEMLKYSSNAFHALKVTFANEIGRICQALDVDSREVMGLLCRDTRLNVSSAYLKPGFAFGGSCLPKDLRALLRVAQDTDVLVPMLSGILPSNRTHIDHAIETILMTGRRSVGIIGLSFKSGTDDLRESPLVLMAEQLIGKGLHLKIYDPEVNLASLVGSNRRYIQETIPHISSMMYESCEKVIQGSEVIVVGLNDDDLVETLCASVRADQYVLDLVGIPRRGGLTEAFFRGICW